MFSFNKIFIFNYFKLGVFYENLDKENFYNFIEI